MNNFFWRPLEGQIIESKYHLKKLLGSGSFGGVFQAAELIRGKLVRSLAIKLIDLELCDRPLGATCAHLRCCGADRAFDELITAVNISHPNLISCYGCGECNLEGQSFLYLLMELGEFNLQTRLKQGNFSFTEAQDLIINLASGIEFFHNLPSPLVHCDLKPANILRVNNTWKIADFGLTRALEGDKITTSSSVAISLGYAPPESFDGVVSPVWDIWSLGVIIYEALTGNLPFTGNTSNQLIKQILNHHPDLSILPQNFREIVAGCLEKEITQRSSAQELIEKIQALAQNTIPAPIATPKTAEQYLAEGNELLEQKKYEEAQKKLSKAIQLEPKLIDAYISLSQVYLNLKKYQRAIINTQKALAIDPNCAKAYYNRGKARYNLEHSQEAVEDFTRAIELNPDRFDSFYYRALAQSNLKNYQEAVKDYTRALELNSENFNVYCNRGAALYNLKNYQQAIKDFNKAIELSPDSFNACWYRGLVNLMLQNYQQAIEDFTTVIQLDPDNFKACYSRGIAYLNLYNYQEAIADYTKALDLKHDFFPAYNKLGLTFYKLKNYQQAIEYLTKSINLNQNNVEGYYNRSLVYQQLRDYQNVINDCTTVIKLDPDYFKAYVTRAEVHGILKNYDEAIEDYTKACCTTKDYIDSYWYLSKACDMRILSQDYQGALTDCKELIEYDINIQQSYEKKAEILILLGRYEEAIKAYEKIIDDVFPYYDPEGFYNQTSQFSEIKEYQKAVEGFKKAIGLSPSDYLYLLACDNIGSYYLIEKKYRRAIKNYNEVIKLDPTNSYAYENRGEAFYKSENYQEAIADYTEAIKLNPNSTDAYVGRGKAHYNLENYQEAIDDYTEAIRLNPNSIDSYLNRAYAFHDLEDYHRAINDYTKTIRLNPNSTDAYKNRGDALSESGNYQEAIADYSKAIELNPNYTDAYKNRGNALSESGNYQEAIADYSKAIELNPNHTDVYFYRAYALDYLQDYHGAIKDYTKVIELNPDYVYAYNNRGVARQELKDYQGAIKDYKKAIELNPDDSFAKNNLAELYKELNYLPFSTENTEDSEDSLDDYSDSEDEANYSDATHTLTASQQKAAESIKNFLNSDNRIFALMGYAGTGKSFLVTHLIKDLLAEKYALALAAPTNKAAKNLLSLCFETGVNQIEPTTIAKLLGLQPELDTETGEEIFSQQREVELANLAVIFLDEASMISKDNLELLQKEVIQKTKAKLIFIGDPAQLPPVGETTPLAFSLAEDRFELAEIVRYDGEIAHVAEEIRSYTKYNQMAYPFVTAADETIITLPEKEWLTLAGDYFKSNEFKNDPNFCRILAYRNKTVEAYSSAVRTMVYGEGVGPYVVGDRLIAKRPVFRLAATGDRNNDYKIIINNSEEMTVIGQYTTFSHPYGGINLTGFTVPIRSDEGREIQVNILDTDSKEVWEKMKNELKEKKRWKDFISLDKNYDDCPFAYALTTHKAQGSSINYVFLDQWDMNGADRQKLLYTALTRAKTRAIIKI